MSRVHPSACLQPFEIHQPTLTRRQVPRLFSPVWAIISRVLPEQHKARIVLLTSSSVVRVPSLAVPQLGSCASSARAWRLRAARHSQGEARPLGSFAARAIRRLQSRPCHCVCPSSSSQTTPDSLAPYLPAALQPPHIRADALAGGWSEPQPDGGASFNLNATATAAAPNAATNAVAGHASELEPEAEAAGWFASAASYFSLYSAASAPAPAAGTEAAPDS